MRLRATSLILAVGASLAIASTAAGQAGPTAVRQLSAPVPRAHTFDLPKGTTHFALHWLRAPGARLRLRLSRDGVRFGRLRPVMLDDLGAERPGREVFGAVTLARGTRAVRVLVSRPLRRVSLVAMRSAAARRSGPVASSATVSQPPIVLRAGWKADESLRFDSSGRETWPSAFYPVQKLIVHHTATQNKDPDPAATIRSIYYYHAVTQGWGDIGYNFLIDEAGRIYEGRHTFDPPSPSPPGEDTRGYGVTAAHAYGYNSGTVGIALLGTLTNQDATPAARSALEQLLAWEADRHGIDPRSSSVYVNPVNGTQATFPNIAGHRDVGATECPGGVFYSTLPTIRSDVAAMLGSGPPPTPTAVTGSATGVGSTSATLNGTINPNGQPASYRFDYGTTTAYGRSTPTASAGSGTTTVAVSAAIAGLTRSKTYHFRVVALDAQGQAYPGADATFRTAKK
jgi:hypothetical protein